MYISHDIIFGFSLFKHVDDLTFDKTRKIIATQMHASLDAFHSVGEGSGKVNYTQKRTLPILKLPLIWTTKQNQ